MKAVYSPLHARHEGGFELYRGQLVPTFETPERAEIIRAAIEAAGHALVQPREIPESRLLGVHDGEFVEFLRGAHARWQSEGRQGHVIPSGFPARGLRPARRSSAPAGQARSGLERRRRRGSRSPGGRREQRQSRCGPRSADGGAIGPPRLNSIPRLSSIRYRPSCFSPQLHLIPRRSAFISGARRLQPTVEIRSGIMHHLDIDRPLELGQTLELGQSWSYRAPAGFEASRLLIGAILTFHDHAPVICCAVSGAPRRLADGSVDRVTIPFLPMSEEALRASVVACDGVAEPPDGFASGLAEWRSDPRGLSMFTVPFEGLLDQMIARQMAAIIGYSAA